MTLRIRLLEYPPKSDAKLNTIQISGYACGHWKLSIASDGTLTRHSKDDRYITVVNAFVHQSRVFYVNQYYGNDYYEILLEDGLFFTALSGALSEYFSWSWGDFISYDDTLLFIPVTNKQPFNALLTSEDFFREYKIIPGNSHLSKYDKWNQSNRMKSILMFQNELLAITQWGSQFYDGKTWRDFQMKWDGLVGSLHENIEVMVVHTKTGDYLFAFSGVAER